MSFLDKLLGDPHKRAISKIQPVVDQINELEPKFKKLSDAQLKKKTEEFRKNLSDGQSLDDLLPEAFAAVRESAKRTIGQRHFDVQLIGGVVLHQGKISEMKTGEGKTLAATLPLYLNALEGKGVHLVTVNDYLARRDCAWMGPIYDALDISVAAINHEKSYLFKKEVKNHAAEGGSAVAEDEQPETVEYQNLVEVSRKEAYAADITYGTNNEFGFDYLRDNMVQSLDQKVQRDLNYAIVDEVDSILIDEARTPLIISAPAEESASLYQKFAQMVPSLKKEADYNVDEKDQAVTLTSEGIKKMESLLGVKNIYEAGASNAEASGITLVHHLEEALKAHALFKKDRDYVVKDGEIIIVDQFTGRLMPGRRYSEGLHQAIEAKEGVEVKRESITMATISFQNYFRMYEKLAGMTGTAETESEEFYKIYGLDVVVIPTNEPMVREDNNDSIYKSEEGKFAAVVEEVKRRNKLGQPVLLGTIHIEKSEVLSEMLREEGIKHNVLNAKYHEKEAGIIAQAGRKAAVTVATNMAGRGVDIILGGSPFNQKLYEEVKKFGGLHVLGTERHEARRIDNQLRGRSGRQGDPGSSQFFVSMEDDLMRIFGGDRIKAIMTTLRMPEDQPIENAIISRSIESAQKKVEGHNFDIRKHLVQYDDVANIHRKAIYKKRNDVLAAKDLKDEMLTMIEEFIARVIKAHTSGEIWNKKEIGEVLKTLWAEEAYSQQKIDLDKYQSSDHLTKDLIEISKKIYEEREERVGSEVIRAAERAVMLRSIDMLWIEHLTAMDELRTGIGLRGYGQRDPLVEYKAEAYRMFQELNAAIDASIVNTIFRIEFAQATPPPVVRQRSDIELKGASEQAAAGTFEGVSTNEPSNVSRHMAAEVASREGVKKHKVGRNEPCPCGSGKKYKKCCGR
jgi:preprotein translocase subunit SecA